MANQSLWNSVPGSMGPNGTNIITLVAAHAAYFQPLGDHLVIIVVSEAAVLSKKKQWNFTFSCAYYDNHAQLRGIVTANFTTRDLVHCPLTSDKQHYIPLYFKKVPENVILFRNDFKKFRVSSPPWLLPVKNNYRKLILNDGRSEGDLAICVKILYADPNWLLLVQFFEYYKLQNVSKFFFKIRTADIKPHIWSILRYYQSQDLLDILPWDINYKFCPKSDKWCMLTQIYFRTAYRYRYVAVCDYDELIVSTNQSLSLLDLVQSVDRVDRGAFTFAAKYHVTNKTALSWETAKRDASAVLSEHLPLVSWNYTSSFIPGSYSPKTIVKPETVKRMWVHFPRHHFRGFAGYQMDTKKHGYFLHFKNSTKWPQMKQTYKWTNYSVTKVRNSPLRPLIKTVEKNVKDSLKAIFKGKT